MSESINLANVFVTMIPSMAGSQGTITKELTNAVVGPADKAGVAGGAAMGAGVLGKAKKVLGPAAVAAAVAGVGTGLYKVGEVFDNVTDTIRVGSGASGEALDGLVESAKKVGKKVPSDFEKVGGTIADLNTRFGMTGETLETVAEQYLHAGEILGEDVDINKTSAAFSAFKIEGDGVIDAMDTLFQVSQATGVGMNELADGVQRSAPAVQALGFSFEETAAMVGSLDKAGLNSNQIMAAMSKSLVTLAKDGEDPQDAFKRVTGEIEGFIAQGDKAAAIDLAGQVFGTRGASQFIGAIESGTLSLGGMMDAAGTTGDTIIGLADETYDFAEKWAIVKNNALVALEPLGSAVFNALGDALSVVMPYVESFGEWLKKNPTAVKIFVGVLGGLAVAFGVAAAALWVMNSALLASPITWIIVGIVAIVAAIVLLWKNWDTVWGWITDKFGVVVNFFKTAWETYGQPVIDAIGTGITWLWDNVFSPVLTWIGDAWQVMVDALTAGWDWIKTNVFGPIQKGLDFVGLAFDLYRQAAVLAWDTVKTALKAGWDWIDRNVFAPIKTGVGWVSDKFTTAKTSVVLAWDLMKSALSAGWDWINRNVFDPFKRGIDAIPQTFTAAKNLIKSVWDQVKGIAASPVNFVIETVYTNGLKKFVESVASSLGISIALPHVAPIKLARGGQLPGFGGGDRIPTILEAGEFVINKHAARAFHPLLAAINGGYGVAPGTVGALGGGYSPSSGCGGGSCGIGLSKGGLLAGIGDFFGDVGRGIGGFLRDPLGAVLDLITKPVEALLGPIANTVWGDLGKGGVRKILSVIPDWFKGKAEQIGNSGLVGAAQKALGVPYVWGGSSIPPGLDCSGLVYWAAQQLGLGWPRLTAAGYQTASSSKGLASAVPGDLLFWGSPAHHVGIYSGPGSMVHAPRPGTVVTNAAIYGSPTVGSYHGGGGAGMSSTYAGLVRQESSRSSSGAGLASRLLARQYDSGGILQPGYTLAYNGTGKPETIRTFEQEKAIMAAPQIGTLNLNVDVSDVEDLVRASDALSALGVQLRMRGVPVNV